MINITRCQEPAALDKVRNSQLAMLRNLGREPTSKEIDGYALVAEALWTSQHHKCCYCEQRIPKGFNDVEHYRPKSFADRLPGCGDTHGYWWLAYTWSNLLFACPGCNRSSKKCRFPLDLGCFALIAEEVPPGNELPLLIDPGSNVNPVEHIEFVYREIGPAGTPRYWWARPRNSSLLGNVTIDVCGLNRVELLELREDHYRDIVKPHALAINAAVNSADVSRLADEFQRALGLLTSQNAFVGLTYDALRIDAPEAGIKILLGNGWPLPKFFM